MKTKQVSTFVTTGIAASILATCDVRAQHSDFVMARDATNKLTLESPDAGFTNGNRFIELDLVVAGPLAGYWASDQPGWESIEADEPDEGLFQLVPGHRLALRRVNWDAGLQMFDLDFSPMLTADSTDYEFGQSPPNVVHEDLWFGMTNDAFDACQRLSGQFQLVDLSGTHQPSDPFMLRFRALAPDCPAVSTWGMSAISLLTMTVGTIVLRRGMPSTV